ncbi:MAG: hypothetical protein ABSG67_03130 [Thermoguttaceae bacterium]|jgi:hypothetical protein
MRTAREFSAIARTIRRRGLPADVEVRRVLDDACHLIQDGRQSIGLRLAAAEVVAAAMQRIRLTEPETIGPGVRG